MCRVHTCFTCPLLATQVRASSLQHSLSQDRLARDIGQKLRVWGAAKAKFEEENTRRQEHGMIERDQNHVSRGGGCI